ncbi:MAG: GldG family protein, partial [Planctomycetes bacterium]|nr:GldG family protein [Planctomycetota bacterium]
MDSASHFTTGQAAGARHAERGGALGVTVHVVLLLLVLGQLVYLASRYRVRVDITSDKLWSLTDSTRSLLGNLDERLLVEAYFSDKDKLPVNVRNTRAVLDNFLDEMVQLGKGKVVVERFDPNSDKAVADKCGRVGIQPADMRSTSSSSVSLDRHWQGLRFVYGGGKQKVLGLVAPASSYQAEATITPAIKEVVTTSKRKFGYMEWPAQQVGQSAAGVGWNTVRTFDQVAKRYELQNFKDEDGALLPDDLQTLFLFRPKDLTDRQKYVFDQFLMRGGTLVVFADAAEYAIGPRRAFTKMPMAIDAPNSKVRFADQLANYGIEWRQKVVADLAGEADMPRDRFNAPFEYFAAPELNFLGQQQLAWKQYPYFFHAVAGDWSNAADQLARDTKGLVDAGKAARYRELFGTGMPSDEFLFQSFRKIGRGPGFYWPTWVGLRQKGGAEDLPAGVTGRVLLRSSPLTLVEDPPQNLDP